MEKSIVEVLRMMFAGVVAVAAVVCHIFIQEGLYTSS